MIKNISFEDKEAIQNDATIPNKNKVTAEDMKRDVIGSIEVAAAAKTENVVINVKKKTV